MSARPSAVAFSSKGDPYHLECPSCEAVEMGWGCGGGVVAAGLRRWESSQGGCAVMGLGVGRGVAEPEADVPAQGWQGRSLPARTADGQSGRARARLSRTAFAGRG
jgi:hypothetical protein